MIVVGFINRLFRWLLKNESFGWLLNVPPGPRRWYDVILWWETRRISYNVIVGLAGFISLLTMLTVDILPPRLPPEQTDFEFFAPIVAGVLANIFYTGGWISEIVLRLFSGQRAGLFGPISFGIGLLFSLIIVSLPAMLDTLFWIIRVIAGVISIAR